MQKKTNLYGTLYNDSPENLFHKTTDLIKDAVQQKNQDKITVGLTGGSTPKAFYQWIVDNNALPKTSCDAIIWSVSDERFVPLENDESNFGNADRLLLKPLEISSENKFPWPVADAPEQSAEHVAAQFNRNWNQQFGAQSCFDICFLGMGDDAHTASLFPGSPLLGSGVTDNFAAVETDKGWRLTITEAGLKRCKQIIVTVIGKNKKETLHNVFEAAYNPSERPIQILRNYSEKVLWLVD